MEINRLNEYSKEHCWQYDIRLKNIKEDMSLIGITKDEMLKLRVSDFQFKLIEDKTERKYLKQFIVRHEWLGTLSQYTTHWFGAYYGEVLAGVILFNMPNAFSKMLGEDTKNLERLISRGACISWSPKNLASSFLMWAIEYMVQNTRYRLFTAYSDPIAKEIGTIYQACSFYYLGQKSGAKKRYVNPYTGKIVSDRFFRQKTSYKKFAKELNIEWEKNWNHSTGMNWHNIPSDIEKLLREYSKQKQLSSKAIDVPQKHKYAFVKGKDKRETKALRKLFKTKNKVYSYPKNRGLWDNIETTFKRA